MQESNYKYKIRYSLKKDCWNWWRAVKYSEFMGEDFVGRLDSEDKKWAYKIKGKTQTEAQKILIPRLKTKSAIVRDAKNVFRELYSKNFMTACKTLERITGKRLKMTEFTIQLTTFASLPYFCDQALFYEDATSHFPNDMGSFLHEVLHMQTEWWWRQDEKSPVSRMPQYEYAFLRESLTVILDDELRPLIEDADVGYPDHQEFRKFLHKEWRRHHDFQLLIDTGLHNIGKFMNK